ncbi:MAG: sugar phosphate isomerase/epimerase [Bryobacteraceae bacterium]|nr:sugar phosphate isomerase/epimerase [Bryobacteraceae bacterium]
MNAAAGPARLTRRACLAAAAAPLLPQPRFDRLPGAGVRIGLNVYSFNEPLRRGAMTLFDAVRFCAEHRIAGIDATGYYFPGYPARPPDDFVRRLRREAFLHGVAIFGTGVRNDFSLPDPEARRREAQLVRDWIEVAAALGAGILRIFSGRGVPEGFTFEQTLSWMAPLIRECAEHGARHGVLIGIQNHDDFLSTAAQTIRLVEAVQHPWCGVILDIGSLRQADPYAEIAQLIPYAVSWQLKENVAPGGREEPADMQRIRSLIEARGWRGWLPIETLGPGDPKEKLARLLARVREAFGPC